MSISYSTCSSAMLLEFDDLFISQQGVFVRVRLKQARELLLKRLEIPIDNFLPAWTTRHCSHS